MSKVTVFVNKGFYINKNGEKIELNQNSLDVVFKSDFDKLKKQLEKAVQQRNIEILIRFGDAVKKSTLWSVPLDVEIENRKKLLDEELAGVE